MAVSIDLRDGELIVHIRGWDRLRAMRGSVRVPLAHVAGARAYPSEAWFDKAIVNSASGVGVYVPGKLAVGTLHTADGRAFYDVHDPANAIAIDLHDEDLRRLVVELADEAPEDAVRRIDGAFHDERAEPGP